MWGIGPTLHGTFTLTPSTPDSFVISPWYTKFMEIWKAQILLYDHNTATDLDPEDDYEDLKDYTGIDYSVDNQWVQDSWCYIGAPYRKEVSPNDSLGTYQNIAFRIREDGTIEMHPTQRHEHYVGCTEICGFSLTELVKSNVSLSHDLYGDNNQLRKVEEVANDVYCEIGLMY